MKQVILASKSPRRKELLERFGFPFICVDANIDEVIDAGLSIPQAIEHVAYQKAAAVVNQYPEGRVISADTIVEMNGQIYGKPVDEADAFRMLKDFSGKEHNVITAVCILEGSRSVTFHSIAKVLFYELTDEEINWYINTKEPMDKAGAYGIQGYGSFLVNKIDGDFFTIMGLPVALLYRKLKELDVNI